MKNKKILLFIIIIIVLLTMSVGFSILSTNINITGNVNIVSQTWNLNFSNITITNSSKIPNSINIDSNDSTKINYNVSLNYGEYLEFTVDAKNSGTLNAIISSINLDLGTYSNYLNYSITYINGESLEIDQMLNINSTEVYKVRIDYNKTSSNQINLNGSFDINYSYSNTLAMVPGDFTLTGFIYDLEGQPLTNGTIVVDNNNLTNIGSNGSYSLKKLSIGNHQLFVKDSNNLVISTAEFSISKGSSTSVSNNNVILSSHFSDAFNIMLTNSNAIITQSNPTYTISLTGENATLQTSILIERGQTANLSVVGTTNYVFREVTCTNNQIGTFDTSTSTLTLNNITSNATCNVRFGEACSYAEGYKWTYAYSGAVKTLTIPCRGTYKLEVYGGAGGDSAVSIGGKGGYSSGDIEFTKSQKIYIVVGNTGKMSNISSTAVTGAYNGGGNAYYGAGTGGGATHIATKTGLLSALSSYKSTILIVAGGGGGASNFLLTNPTNGGAGGGLNGVIGDHLSTFYPGGGLGGTQTAGGTYGNDVSNSTNYIGASGTFGKGGKGGYNTSYKQGSGAGGAGYFGGGGGSGRNGGGGGGAGYIEGLANAISLTGNETIPTQDGTGTTVGNSGAGYAKITLLKL